MRKGKKVNIPLLIKYAWQHKFNFWHFRLDLQKIKLLSTIGKSSEYCNDETLIKHGKSISYEVFSWYQEYIKKKLKKILIIHTQNRHRCP